MLQGRYSIDRPSKTSTASSRCCTEVFQVLRVTSVHIICDAMNSNDIFKEMLPTVHQLRLYLTLPITLATSERIFSALRRLLTYMRSKMTEKRLNNCLLLHIHKDNITDSLNVTSVAKEFISLTDERFLDLSSSLWTYIVMYIILIIMVIFIIG